MVTLSQGRRPTWTSPTPFSFCLRLLYPHPLQPPLPFPADPLVFRLHTCLPPETVHTTFLREQWSQDFCHTPSASQMQYCLWHRHRSYAQSPLVPVSA